MAEWPRECDMCGRMIRQKYRGRPRKYCRPCGHEMQQRQMDEYRYRRREERHADRLIGDTTTRSHLNYSALKARGQVQ